MPGLSSARVTLLGTLALCMLLLSCQEESAPEPSAPSGRALDTVPAMSFAGASLQRTLRRVAQAVDILLVVDEFRDAASNPDLAYYDVDLDLPEGPLHETLALLSEHTEAFDYALTENVIYVRSRRLAESATPLDLPLLKAARFEGTLPDLTRYLLEIAPDSLLRSSASEGQPYYQKVTLHFAPGDSIADALIKYATAIDRGLWIRRAGHLVEKHADSTAFMATTVEMWGRAMPMTYIPDLRQDRSTLTALAAGQRASGIPIVIFDRTLIPNMRGSLDYFLKVYNEGYALEKNLASLASTGERAREDFTWEMQDGVVIVHSDRFDMFVSGMDLINEKLRGGSFEGTLVQFVRWLSEHRANPNGRRLMGGEIVPGGPVAKLEIADGTRLAQAITAFARASGDGINYVIAEADQVDRSETQELHRSRGAFITRLDDWYMKWEPPEPVVGPKRKRR